MRVKDPGGREQEVSIQTIADCTLGKARVPLPMPSDQLWTVPGQCDHRAGTWGGSAGDSLAQLPLPSAPWYLLNIQDNSWGATDTIAVFQRRKEEAPPGPAKWGNLAQGHAHTCMRTNTHAHL